MTIAKGLCESEPIPREMAAGRSPKVATNEVIMMGRNLFNNELILFGMLVIGLSGFVVDKLLGLIGRRVLWWRV